jgi:iron complex transport system permease protein
MKRAQVSHIVWGAVVALALVLIFAGSGLDFDYVIPKRLVRLAAIAIGAICIAVSSITFQTIAGNRILTPSIMGYEAVYLFLQALLLLFMGTYSLVLLGQNGNFFISVLLMLSYSWAIHRWLFRDGGNNVYFLLLLGLVLTMVIGTFTQFVQLRISPGEFAVFQGFSQASFDNIQPVQLLYSAPLVALVCLAVFRSLPVLDVIALGRDQAISSGCFSGLSPFWWRFRPGCSARRRSWESLSPTSAMRWREARAIASRFRSAAPSPWRCSSPHSSWSGTSSTTRPLSASSSIWCAGPISSR